LISNFSFFIFYVVIKKKIKKKYHNVGTFPKLNIAIVERGKIDTPNPQIHDHSLSWLGTDTSIKKSDRLEKFYGYEILTLNIYVK